MENKENALISAIIIFLNGERFIEESIESVIKQTYSNWELLLVDDGSTDQSSEIAKRYSRNYPGKILYLEHPAHQNRGMSASRNLGINNAQGDFVCFLDADDIWLPEKFEEQYEIMKKNPGLKMLYGNSLYWWSWTKEKLNADSTPRLGVKPNSIVNPPDLIPKFLDGSAAVPCPCGLMCRREIFEKIKFEDSFRGLYEDQAFYFKVCSTEKVYVTDKILDKYRQHPDSVCYDAEKKGVLMAARIYFLHWFWNYLMEHNINDPEVKIAVIKEFQKNIILMNKNIPDNYKNLVRRMIKWIFRFEKIFLPNNLRLYLWMNGKTINYLSAK